MFQYQLTIDQTNAALSLEGDMDIDATEIIEDEIIPVISQYDCVEISFTKVRFVDSTGIGLLITLVQRSQENGINVTISNVNAEVNEVFSLLQIPDILGKDVFV
jgi:anti-anti-sigma factor